MDKIVSFINILKIISDSDGFRKWMRQYHNIEDDSFLLDGYKFFTEVVVSDLIESFHSSSAFGLEDDITYYRAHFVGVNVDDIPNTSEKIIFIKNVWNRFQEIDNSSSWDEIKLFWQNIYELFLIFDSIHSENIICTKDIDKELALKATTMFYTYIFLIDTRKGKPFTYPASILKNKLSPEFMEKSYDGYIFCLQYVWYALMGKVQFEKSSLKMLHNAFDIYSQNIEDYEKSPLSFEYHDNQTSLALIKWKSIDYFFSIIKEEIIKPLEKDTGLNLSEGDILILDDDFDKTKLGFLLSPSNLPNPDYINDENTNASKIKQLDYYFLWQMFFKMDCQQIIVDGAVAFTDLLIGAVQKNRHFKNEDKIQVLRIKHPVIGSKGFDYTYAILIESYAIFSDYSVWYVFFDCATDYSGFGGSLHQSIELFINRYLKENAIEIKELTIEKDFFEDYLDKGILSSITRIRNESEGILGNTKGTPLENIAYEVNKEIRQWNGSQDSLKQNVDNLIFVLKANIPKNLDNEIILKKIEEIELTNDVAKHYSIISLIIPLLLKVNMEEKLDSIDKKIDDISLKVEELTNSHDILEFIIQNLEIIKNEIPELNNQINAALSEISDKSKSTEQKLKFSIPIIPTLVTYELEKDVPDIISKRIRALDELKIKLRKLYKW